MSEIKKLSDNWTFYIHLQENKDWSIDSYIKIMNFNNVEEAILLNDEITLKRNTESFNDCDDSDR